MTPAEVLGLTREDHPDLCEVFHPEPKSDSYVVCFRLPTKDPPPELLAEFEAFRKIADDLHIRLKDYRGAVILHEPKSVLLKQNYSDGEIFDMCQMIFAKLPGATIVGRWQHNLPGISFRVLYKVKRYG